MENDETATPSAPRIAYYKAVPTTLSKPETALSAKNLSDYYKKRLSDELVIENSINLAKT